MVVNEIEAYNTQNSAGRRRGMGDISGLLNAIKEAGMHEKQELVKRITESIFARQQFP